jgi:RNA polymerase sigma-70 factor (ECF subfamily)
MTNAEFLNKYHNLDQLLFAFAMRLTKNRSDADDLMQETALRAFSNKDRFKTGTNFKAWMTTIMRNTFINNYRKRRTRNNVEQSVDENMEAIRKKSVVNIAESTMAAEEIQQIVDELDDGSRIPFLMFFQGYHYKEIANTMDLKMGTVKSRIFFARKKIKNEIQARYGKQKINELLVEA